MSGPGVLTCACDFRSNALSGQFANRSACLKSANDPLSGHGATQNSGLPRSTSCASNTPDSHAAMWYASTDLAWS